MSTLARRLNANLNLNTKLSVVAGGSQGIGQGIALRLAKAGSSVLVIGRSEERLKGVVEQCRRASDAAGGENKTFDYISADLSTVSGIKSAIASLKDRCSPSQSIDYLFQTQGGPPNGSWSTNPEGHETRFVVQS